MSNRATQILPHHRYVHSLGAPLACVQGTITKGVREPGQPPRANHQHLIVKIDKVLKFEGGTQNLVGTRCSLRCASAITKGLPRKSPGLQSRPAHRGAGRIHPPRQASIPPTTTSETRTARAPLHSSSRGLRVIRGALLQLGGSPRVPRKAPSRFLNRHLKVLAPACR